MLNDLLAFPWGALALMLVGVAAITWLVVWPIAWVVMYGIGNTIFHALTVDWGKAKAKPLTLAKYLIWKWPLAGMKEAVTCPADSVTAGPWEWRPLFKYRKRKS
jgi:hypothetical protein